MQISFDRHVVSVKHSSLSIQVAPTLFHPGAQLQRYDPTVFIQISFSKIESVSHVFSSSVSFLVSKIDDHYFIVNVTYNKKTFPKHSFLSSQYNSESLTKPDTVDSSAA